MTGLPPTLVVQPGARAGVADQAGARLLSPGAARALFQREPVLIAHAMLTARRLGVAAPARSADLYDVLELYAFVRPAQACAPSAVGLARALGRPEPKGVDAQAQALREIAAVLLDELAEAPRPSREEALATALTLQRAGWAWGADVVQALERGPRKHAPRGSGLDVWSRLAEWEDQAPEGQPGSAPVSPEAARDRLTALLARAGLAEARPAPAAVAPATPVAV